MAFQELVPGDVVEVIVFGLMDGQSVLNVFHYKLMDYALSGNVQVTVKTISDGVRTLWRNQICPLLSQGYSVVQYQATVLLHTFVVPDSNPPRINVQVGDRSISPGVPNFDIGTKAGDPLPTFNAIGAIKRTAKGGRDGKGAIRLGPFPDTDIDGNNVDTVINGAVIAALEVLLVSEDPFNPTDKYVPQGALLRRTAWFKAPPVVTPPAAYAELITAVEARPYASSQVSRKKKKTIGA